MEKNWVSVEEKMPENTGCYLCYANDGWQLVCFVNVLGQWMLRPGGYCYGDLHGRDDALGLGDKREITHWMPLPHAPVEKTSHAPAEK